MQRLLVTPNTFTSTQEISLTKPTKCQRNSHVHFSCPLLISWITQLIQRWRARISKHGVFHPAMEEKTPTFTWRYNVGHACCSTATEQTWALLNGSVDGPERNNKQFACFYLPVFPFFHSSTSPCKSNATAVKNTRVLALFSVSSYSLLKPTTFTQVQHTWSSGFFKYQTFSEMMHFDFCPYLCMYLLYAQLLVSWREEVHWPILAWV